MYERNDYWLLKEPRENKDARYHLVRVLESAKKDASEVRVVFEKDKHDKEKRREDNVNAADLTIRLGAQPQYGSVYGVKVEPHLFTKEHAEWGKVRFYRKLSDVEKKRLEKAMTETSVVLDKAGLTNATTALSHVELRHKCGRWAGKYCFRPKGEQTDFIILAPHDFTNSKHLRYLLVHEAMHGVWFRLMDELDRAAWVDLFTEYAESSKVTAKQAVKMLDTWLASGDSIDAYAKSLEEVEAERLWAVFDCVKTRSNLKARNIERLRSSGRLISKFWPDHGVDVTDMATPLSEYASTEPEEFFAEALAFHLTGMLHFTEDHKKEMPAKVQSLIKKTLKGIKGK